jgi:predicted ATPase
MSKAQPGQVILDSEIWDSASSAFVGESLPPVNLKGIEGPVVIVNVRQIRRGTRLLPPDRPLLGRETEQARLHQALTELAATATGRAWLISGETGLGKTSLVADLAEQARQQELTVLIGRCQPHGKTVPLFAWVDLLTGWLDFNEQTSPSLQRVRLAEELASLELGALDKILANLLALPALDTLKEVNLGTADSAPATSGSLLSLINHKLQTPSPPPPLAQPSLLNMLQQRLTQPQPASQSLWTRLEERVNSPQAILKLLTKLAQRQPLLLILEDIYWLDPDSAAVLHELFRQLPNLPIMLLLTSHEPEALPHLVIDLPLAKLTTPILEQIGARALGASALDPSLAEWICRHADGNPLYVHELGQALEQTESIRVDKDTGLVHWTGQAPPLPLSLRALLLARLDELSLTQQAVLKRAAVIGSTFSLAELLELSRPQLGEAELQEVLVGAIATSFLVPLQETRYGFNHPLMQETIYATLTFSQRQKWHTQMGDWLAAHQAEPEQYLELMAFHYLRGHNSDKATQYGLQAGDKARQRGAYSGAGDYYSQVLALPHLPAAVQLSAYEAQADLLALQGNYLAALTAYSQAVQLGSRTAQEKQLILAGEVEQLAQATFSAEFQPWARGGQAWLLARQHQSELALRQLQLALPQADQVALPILEALAHLLETGEEIGPYDQWLKRFTQTKLGLST